MLGKSEVLFALHMQHCLSDPQATGTAHAMIVTQTGIETGIETGGYRA